jgi:hypothetical protein
VDRRADLDTEARGKILSPLPGIEPRSHGRPAHSQTSYPANFLQSREVKFPTTVSIENVVFGESKRHYFMRKMEGTFPDTTCT